MDFCKFVDFRSFILYIFVWVVSVEDDFGFFEEFLGGFCWSIPWTHLYKLRRTHRRAVVAVVVAVAVAAVMVAAVAAVAVVTAAARGGGGAHLFYVSKVLQTL